MIFDLPHIWAGIIAFAILAYVALDGMDLGIGLIFPFLPGRDRRDVMMNTVAPVWDGNETWLVLGGGGLFAAFPLAYAIIAPAVYPPLIAMLLGLIFRGVAFEFRFKAETDPGKIWWSYAFAIGSFTAAFCQGLIVGALVQGIEIDGRNYAGGWFDWLTPFTVFCGFAVVSAYSLLGCAWLILKTEGSIQFDMFRLFPVTLALTVASLAILSIWMLIDHPEVIDRWFASDAIYFTLLVPILAGAAGAGLVWCWREQNENLPYPLALSLFVISFIGLAISLYPNLIPPSLTIYDAAAPDESLSFLLWGAAFLIPIILAYTIYSYWVFRGKVRVGDGYH